MTERRLCRFDRSQEEELGEEKWNDVEFGNGRGQALFLVITVQSHASSSNLCFARTRESNENKLDCPAISQYS